MGLGGGSIRVKGGCTSTSISQQAAHIWPYHHSFIPPSPPHRVLRTNPHFSLPTLHRHSPVQRTHRTAGRTIRIMETFEGREGLNFS
jgi:hypothetical protein